MLLCRDQAKKQIVSDNIFDKYTISILTHFTAFCVDYDLLSLDLHILPTKFKGNFFFEYLLFATGFAMQNFILIKIIYISVDIMSRLLFKCIILTCSSRIP